MKKKKTTLIIVGNINQFRLDEKLAAESKQKHKET
jgi:hypothetical protein